MWLGHPDPATALLEQVRHDPDGDALGGLMAEWRAVFGSTPTTVRKAVETAIHSQPNLLDAIREFPVEERGEINRSKLGWLLKKNANRIVGGFEFRQAEADGRTAWRVVAVQSPPLTPSPPYARSVAKTVTPASDAVGGGRNMSPTEVIERAAEDGVLIALSPSGSISAKGVQSAIDRWLPAIQQNKAAIIRLLRPGDGWVGRPRTGERSSTSAPGLPSSMAGCRAPKPRRVPSLIASPSG